MKLINLLLVLTILFSGCSQISDDLELNQEQSITTTTSEVSNKPMNEPQANFDPSGYTEVSADSCSLSGARVANAKVDIGYDSDYANREYWAYTNQYSQLVYVEAKQIILQNDDQEIAGDDRYCNDEAKVPGVEQSDLDEGHVIADSLGGTSNAYNITPQESSLNRHGIQAEIEDQIRDAGGATNFTAEIEYPDTQTQIPSSYTLSYEINGSLQTHTFANEYTADGMTETTNKSNELDLNTTADTSSNNRATSDGDVYYQNCTAVRDAGAAPITSDDPGYSSKLDRDGDGVACE